MSWLHNKILLLDTFECVQIELGVSDIVMKGHMAIWAKAQSVFIVLKMKFYYQNRASGTIVNLIIFLSYFVKK